MTRARRDLGIRGEEAVARWYFERGYEVVARNWRGRAGELDLVLRRGSLVAFCEVKTRSSTAFGTPAEAVTPLKQRRLRRLAGQWLSEQSDRPSYQVRFDVASVLAGRIEVLEAAF